MRVATPQFGQSMRFVVDFADPDATTLVLPLGTSGHLGSPHRTDQLRDWLRGRSRRGTAPGSTRRRSVPPLVFEP